MRLIFKKVKNGVAHKLCSGLHGCGKYLHPDCFSVYKTKQGLVRQKSKCKECCKAYMRSFKAGNKLIQGMDKDDYIDLQYLEITPQQVINYPVKKGSNREISTGMFGY